MKKKKLIAVCGMVVLITIFVVSLSANQSGVSAAPFKQRIWSENSLQYQNHHFYGESLHIETERTSPSYRLIHIQSEKEYLFQEQELDKGIELEILPVGEYAILLDDAHVEVATSDTVSQTWHTVSRKKNTKSVQVTTRDGRLILLVERVKQLPETIYDIVIDPGHGGMDSGASGSGLVESEVMLELSVYLAEQLEAEGFKVKLTRTADVDPAGDDSYSLEESPYYLNGRIEQVYQHEAKLYLSNHLNETEGQLANGFQIYSSVQTTNELAQLLSTALQQSGMEAATHDNPGAQGEGTFTKVDTCIERITGQQSCRDTEEDYLYAIRESGGELTSAQKLVLYNFAYESTPNFGAEGILIEYFFMNNQRETELWQENWQTYADAIVQAITLYLQTL